MTVAIPLVIIFAILVWALRPAKGLTSSGRLAMLVALIPPIAVAIAAVIIQLLHKASGTTSVSDISNSLFIAGLGLIGAAVLASIGFALKRKLETAKAIGFSICIAVIVYLAVLGVLEWSGGV
jgi:hypothetical protein